MRIENVVKEIKDRQAGMQEAVFKRDEFDAVAFAKAQGRWGGLNEALLVISEQMRKEQRHED